MQHLLEEHACEELLVVEQLLGCVRSHPGESERLTERGHLGGRSLVGKTLDDGTNFGHVGPHLRRCERMTLLPLPLSFEPVPELQPPTVRNVRDLRHEVLSVLGEYRLATDDVAATLDKPGVLEFRDW